MNKETPIVLAVTGASALPLAEMALKLLLANKQNVYLILSKGAYKVFLHEHSLRIPIETKSQVSFWRSHLSESKGDLRCFKWDDIAANIASGSFKTKGMAILPCTMGTVGRIASGVATGLIERCADVHLKEGRKLVISPRETPFNLIHLKNLNLLAEAGAVVAPAMPAWYCKPKNIDELIEFMVVRMFDNFGDDLKKINRWEGESDA